jgi:hypothetical protein
MHDHSIGIVAAQVKTSSSELPLIDRLSALTVATIKDEPDAMHGVAALVPLRHCWRATARWRFIFAREVSELEPRCD